jgi:hypothetical protein
LWAALSRDIQDPKKQGLWPLKPFGFGAMGIYEIGCPCVTNKFPRRD